MEIKKQQLGNYNLYHLKGRLDRESTDFVLAELSKPSDQKMILNITDVSYIDSTGYGALVKLWKTVTYQKGEMHLLCKNQVFYKKLRDLNLHKIIHIFQSNKEFEILNNASGKLGGKVRTSQMGKVLIVSFQGPLESLAESLAFKEFLISKIEGKEMFMALDFSQVDYIYSELISVIITCKKMMDAKDGKLVFLGIKEELFGVFERVGISHIIENYPDQKALMTALKLERISPL